MALSKRLQWLQQNDYFEAAPIVLVKLIHGSKSLTEVLFWYGFILFCLGMTIKNVVSLVVDYTSGATVTNMKIGRSDQALFPNLTFCIQMKLPEVNPEFVDDGKGIPEEPRKIISLEGDVTNAIQKFKSRNDVINGQWSYILLPLLFR